MNILLFLFVFNKWTVDADLKLWDYLINLHTSMCNLIVIWLFSRISIVLCSVQLIKLWKSSLICKNRLAWIWRKTLSLDSELNNSPSQSIFLQQTITSIEFKIIEMGRRFAFLSEEFKVTDLVLLSYILYIVLDRMYVVERHKGKNRQHTYILFAWALKNRLCFAASIFEQKQMVSISFSRR